MAVRVLLADASSEHLQTRQNRMPALARCAALLACAATALGHAHMVQPPPRNAGPGPPAAVISALNDRLAHGYPCPDDPVRVTHTTNVTR